MAGTPFFCISKPAAVRKMFDSAIGLKFDAYDNQKKVWGSFTGQK